MAMQKQDFISGPQNTRARMHVDGPLPGPDKSLTLDREQSHYLVRVMRATAGDKVLLFNAPDGEWLAELVEPSKSAAGLKLLEQTRVPRPSKPLTLVFPPLRKERLAILIEKAVELGVTHFQPFTSDHTNWKYNVGKLEKIALEAVEQCERLDLPDFSEIRPLEDVLEKPVLVALERGKGTKRIAELDLPTHPALMIGPEGGFSPRERDMIDKSANAQAISLGTSILRAETAGIVGLTLIQGKRETI